MQSLTHPGGTVRQHVRKMRIRQKKFRLDNQKKIIYPYITLCGPWLLDSGFRVGRVVEVLYEMNRVVIRPGKK